MRARRERPLEPSASSARDRRRSSARSPERRPPPARRRSPSETPLLVPRRRPLRVVRRTAADGPPSTVALRARGFLRASPLPRAVARHLPRVRRRRRALRPRPARRGRARDVRPSSSRVRRARRPVAEAPRTRARRALPAEVATLEENADEIAALGLDVRAVGASARSRCTPFRAARARLARPRLVRDLVAEVSRAAAGVRSTTPSTSCSRRWRATARCARATRSRAKKPRPSCVRSTPWTSQGTARTVARSSRASLSTSWSGALGADERARRARAVAIAEEDPERAPRRRRADRERQDRAGRRGRRARGRRDRQRGQRPDLPPLRHRLRQAVGRGARARTAPPPRRPRSPRAGRRRALRGPRPRRDRRHSRARGKRVVVCGGTFLWVKALIYGLADAPPASDEVRARHRAIEASEGRPALHAAPREVDPDIAARLHPNDLVRVSRALEVHELTGAPDEQRVAGPPRLRDARASATRGSSASTRSPPRKAHEAASRRGCSGAWIGAGWVDEVRRLSRPRATIAPRAMGSVGYREAHGPSSRHRSPSPTSQR